MRKLNNDKLKKYQEENKDNSPLVNKSWKFQSKSWQMLNKI